MKQRIKLKYQLGEKYVGKDSRTLVSALVGSSSVKDISGQQRKIEAISRLEVNDLPDIISDLSLNASKSDLYKFILQNYPQFIVSTLPIYQCNTTKGIIESSELLHKIHEQVEAGVGFITIHPTPTKEIISLAQKRLVPMTSRGGGIVVKDLLSTNFKRENVYLRILDDIIKCVKKRDTVISLGASFRSANIFDSLDDCQIEEFKMQKQLADYIQSNGVDTIVEGPGHTSPQKLKKIATYYQQMGYPIMPLGPIPTDTSIGQDHISSSIGAVLLGLHDCVDIITSVTREEHTGGIPKIESTLEAIKAAKVAAHIIDMNNLEYFEGDAEIANYRATFKTCVYGKKSSGCNRCSEVCPLKL